MYLLYDLILLVVAAMLIPFYLVRSLRYGKSRRGIRERFGFFAPGRLDLLRGKQVIWIHAVSVGETRAALPLLKGLRKQYPDALLLLSNVTETGHAVAEEIPELDLCFFFPFDLSWAVRRVLKQIRPDLIVIVETEIWPNFVRAARQQQIPLSLVNGRLSDRSFPRYRMVRALLRPILGSFSAFCMQSETDVERVKILGAAEEMVTNSGNLKFDLQVRNVSDEDVSELKYRYRLSPKLPVIAAGSTHAGEEEMVARTFQRLLTEGCDVLLVLVPRHPERCRHVAEMLGRMGISCRLRSQSSETDPVLLSGEVLLVDTLGEMLNIYALSDVVFVGGSLVPVGGHNLLEASLVGKPVLFGPHMQNFREISRLLLEVGAGSQISDELELGLSLQRLLADRALCSKMGQAGRALIEQNVGATDRTLEVLGRHLPVES